MCSYELAKRMRIERECVKHGDRHKRNSVQEDKALIAAYDAVIEMLEDPKERRITFCGRCKYWDEHSGLTVRMCQKQNRYTKQHDYCSDAKEITA